MMAILFNGAIYVHLEGNCTSQDTCAYIVYVANEVECSGRYSWCKLTCLSDPSFEYITCSWYCPFYEKGTCCTQFYSYLNLVT